MTPMLMFVVCVILYFCIFAYLMFLASLITSDHLNVASDSETTGGALVVKVGGVGCRERGGKGTWKR